jgi:acetyl-CoA carboxylase carboxyl transferase subunit beta
MSWLQKLLPPKINRSEAAGRKSVPEGLWIKCPACEAVLYKNDLEKPTRTSARSAATTTASARGRASTRLLDR